MDVVNASEHLAKALGCLTKEGLEAIRLTLSYLGIAVSCEEVGDSTEIKLTTPLDLGSDISGVSRAWLDTNNKIWRLEHPPINREDNGLHDSSSDASSPHISIKGPVPTKDVNELCRHNGHKPSVRWTEQLPHTAHVEFLRSRDWGATSLGPMCDWSVCLQLMTLKMLADPRPANLYWGSHQVAIYNEPFSIIASSRHPMMMGSTAEDAMPATWPFLSQVFKTIYETGDAYSLPCFEMSVEKISGFVEEAYYDGVFYPIRNEFGQIEGLYNSGYEITDPTIDHRRQKLLHRISAATNFHQTSSWQHIIDACIAFERDIPLLVVYSTPINNTAETGSLILEGCLGIDRGHSAIPETMDIRDESNGFLHAFRSARAQDKPHLLEMPDGTLPDFLSEGIQWRGHGEPATHIAIIPVSVTGLNAGFLVVGLNPRRPYDAGHEQFVLDIELVCTSVLSASISFEQARAREAKLSRELTQKEKYIKKMAEVATVGIYNVSAQGTLTWANSRFYTITHLSDEKEDICHHAFLQSIKEEDQDKVKAANQESYSRRVAQTLEVRLKATWTPPHSQNLEPCWILSSTVPNIEDDQVTGVIGSITDISHLKWAEQLQENIAMAAKEAKAQQEKFFDMTSHELRNPLSAIMQCADDIAICAEQMHRYPSTNMDHDLEAISENAQSIMFCASHQKRIIDDILTVSKLDTAMLIVTPVPVDPWKMLGGVANMFKAELQASDISLISQRSQSYLDMDVNLVLCDPSRLTQILINLLTNAIKFTKTREKRNIRLSLAASPTPPIEKDTHLHWFPSERSKVNGKDYSGPDTDDTIYLLFRVQDTGRGITGEEMLLLFHRFAQANSKTHVQYGGSGLGLFISRELIELHGGMIGCASVPFQGSTFAFYVKVKTSSGLVAPSATMPETRPVGRKRHLSMTASTLPTRSLDRVKPHILVVEDNLLNQKVLCKQLQRLGCTVHVANHGLEALSFLETTEIWRQNRGVGVHLDVVLMDWEMPVCTGLTCTRRIREMEREGLITEHLRIIGTTANARPEQVDTALAAGMDDLLAKPFKVADVMEMISQSGPGI